MSTNHIEGRVVIITGAAGGFGRLVAQKTAALGARVVAADVHDGELEATAASIRDSSGVVETVELSADASRLVVVVVGDAPRLRAPLVAIAVGGLRDVHDADGVDARGGERGRARGRGKTPRDRHRRSPRVPVFVFHTRRLR